ncbi:hypothetical protein MHYP_G00102790 [Metynnis hypsauchen]
MEEDAGHGDEGGEVLPISPTGMPVGEGGAHVNLLGRDMLADLQIAVVPVGDGLQAQHCADLAMVLEEISAPHYWYSLDFVNMGSSSITQALLDKARVVGHLSCMTTLLSQPHLTIERRTGLNPSTLMLNASEGTPHNCLAQIAESGPSV